MRSQKIWGWGIHGLDGWGIYGIHGGNIVDGRLLGVGHSWSSHDHGFGPFEQYNVRSLNPLKVAHNFTKAIDERPDYQVNFA